MSLYSMYTVARNSGPSQRTHARSEPSNHAVDPHLSQFHERVVLELKQKLAHRDYRSSQRTCPTCSGRFIQFDVDHVPLEFCRDCHCWWFDAAELLHFTELFEDISDGDFADRGSTLPCPDCGKLMREQQLRVNSNLMVHACPQQHGVFLEDGEFERALEVSDRVTDLAGHLSDEHLAVWRQLQARLSAGEFDSSELRCIECGNNAVIVSVDGVDIDYCTQCQSCWFDTKELQHFTHQPSDVPGRYLTSRETTHVCPSCRRQMRLYQFRPKSTVTVEACPGGHGVYLRSGQFPRVLQASE